MAVMVVVVLVALVGVVVRNKELAVKLLAVVLIETRLYIIETAKGLKRDPYFGPITGRLLSWS